MMKFDEANKTGKEMMDSSLKSYAAMTKGMQAIASEATDFSKKAYEQNAATFEKMASAKSVEKAMELQTEYVKSAYESFVAQATKMGELYTDMAKEAYKPFENTVASATK